MYSVAQYMADNARNAAIRDAGRAAQPIDRTDEVLAVVADLALAVERLHEKLGEIHAEVAMLRATKGSRR